MGLLITRASEPITVSQLVLVMLGQPGIGKTTAAQTASKPITFDFDAGIYRSAFRKDSVGVNDWREVANLSPADVAAYDTIVVDTGGRALDCITSHVVRENPKLATSAGNLTLQGYGELKAVFTKWIARLRETGKDIVILCHDAEDKRGDDLIVRPDIQGGSRQEVIKAADAVGYMFSRGKDKVLDFSPNSVFYGKNPAGLEPFILPVFEEGSQPTFLADIIARIKGRLNQRTEEQIEAVKILDEWRVTIEGVSDLDGYNALLDTMKKQESVPQNAKRLLVTTAKKAGFVMKDGQFVGAA